MKDATNRTVGQLADQGNIRAEGARNMWGSIGEGHSMAINGYQQGQDRVRAEEDRQDRHALNKSELSLSEENRLSAEQRRMNEKSEMDLANGPPVVGPPKTYREARMQADIEGARLGNRATESSIRATDKSTSLAGADLARDKAEKAKLEAQQKIATMLQVAARSPQGSPERTHQLNQARLLAPDAGYPDAYMQTLMSQADTAQASATKQGAAADNLAQQGNPLHAPAYEGITNAQTDAKELSDIVDSYQKYAATPDIDVSGNQGRILDTIAPKLTPQEKDRVSSKVSLEGSRTTRLRQVIEERKANLQREMTRLQAMVTNGNITTLKPAIEDLGAQLQAIDQALKSGVPTKKIQLRRINPAPTQAGVAPNGSPIVNPDEFK